MARQRRRQVRSRRESTDGSARRWIAVVAIVGIVAGIGWWWWHNHRSLTQSISSPPAHPAVTNPPVFFPILAPSPSPPTNAPTTNHPPVQVSTNIVRTPPPATTEPALSAPATPTDATEESARATTWLAAQLALVARGISPGSIDGLGGVQSIEALRAFQIDQRLETNGRLDPETSGRLTLSGPSFAEFVLTATHLARLRPLPKTWLGKSEAAALEYESLPELVGEMTQSHPGYIRRLNPEVDWEHPQEGLRLKVPAARFPPARRAALIRISLTGKWLRTFDENGRLLGHFPCSIAARVEKRPVGGLSVAVTVKDPNYTFDPDIFPESAEARTLNHKLVLPPGPNNPVGVAWIGLDRPGYGIHGTPSPEQVGRTESHGCFRLANWNAEYLRQMCWVGLRVSVER